MLHSMNQAGKKPKKQPRRDAGRPRGAPLEAQILTKTVEELALHGFEGLSIERVATASEVNRSTIYRRWASREELVAAALVRVLKDLEVQSADTGSLEGDLRVLALSVAAFLSGAGGRALAQAVFAGAAAPRISALAQERLAEEAHEEIVALVARAVARGEWRLDAHPERVFSLLVGGMLHRLFLEAGVVDEAYVDHALDILLAGVKPRA